MSCSRCHEEDLDVKSLYWAFYSSSDGKEEWNERKFTHYQEEALRSLNSTVSLIKIMAENQIKIDKNKKKKCTWGKNCG